MTLRALIFDVDGTLAETEELHRRAFNETFREAELSWEWDRALYAALLKTAGGRERILHYMKEFKVGPTHWAEATTLAGFLHKEKSSLYRKLLGSEKLTPRAGVRRLIDEARAEKIKLAVATTTGRDNTVAVLKNLFGEDGPRWFAVLATAEDTRTKKPDPEIYRVALRRLELSAATCMAIEDSEIGLKAARGASVGTVITPSSYTGEDDFSGALAVISDLAAGEMGAPVTLAVLNEWLIQRG